VNPAAYILKTTNFVLAFAFVWLLSLLVSQFFSKEFNSFSLSLPSLSYNDTEQSQEISLIGKLFGEVPAKPKETLVTSPKSEMIDPDALADTRLNLKLNGVITSPQKNIAIIDRANQTLVLTENDELSPRVFVKEIYEQYVVINNKGALEKLALPGVKSLGGSKVAKPVTGLLSQADKDKLLKVREQIQKSPLMISRYIRVRTIQKNGKLHALQLWPRKDREIFEALGFRSGDRLVSVNGRSIQDLSENQQDWQKLMKLSNAQLTVERNGSQQTISINLN